MASVAEYLPKGGVETPAWKRDVERRSECRAIASAMIDEARAAGRYGPAIRFCANCRRWVRVIWYVDRQKSLCPPCAQAAGLGFANVSVAEVERMYPSLTEET
jgi:hypothetical protein